MGTVFSRDSNNRTGGIDFKLKGQILTRSCLRGTVKHWLALPGEAAEPPSLEAFQVRLDRALGDLICLKMSLPIAGQLD